MDVVVSPSGQVSAVIVGVGGFLGAGEKDVAVNFASVKRTTKDKSLSHDGHDEGRSEKRFWLQIR